MESLDDDAWDRNIQPVKVLNPALSINNGPTFKNLLNSFRNGLTDGFYTKLKRESKFPSMVYLDAGSHTYDLEFTGSVPNKMRF